MNLTHRIAAVHTNQRDHIPLAYRQFTKLPSYVTSCMMLHRIDEVDDDDVTTMFITNSGLLRLQL